MSITSKPLGLGANPLNTLSTQLGTLERKLNKLEAQLVKATTQQAAAGNTGIVPQQAAAGNTGIVPQQAAAGNTASCGQPNESSYDYRTDPRSIGDLFEILAGPGTRRPPRARTRRAA